MIEMHVLKQADAVRARKKESAVRELDAYPEGTWAEK